MALRTRRPTLNISPGGLSEEPATEKAGTVVDEVVDDVTSRQQPASSCVMSRNRNIGIHTMEQKISEPPPNTLKPETGAQHEQLLVPTLPPELAKPQTQPRPRKYDFFIFPPCHHVPLFVTPQSTAAEPLANVNETGLDRRYSSEDLAHVGDLPAAENQAGVVDSSTESDEDANDPKNTTDNVLESDDESSSLGSSSIHDSAYDESKSDLKSPACTAPTHAQGTLPSALRSTHIAQSASPRNSRYVCGNLESVGRGYASEDQNGNSQLWMPRACNAKFELGLGVVVRCPECGCRVVYKARTRRIVQFEAR